MASASDQDEHAERIAELLQRVARALFFSKPPGLRSIAFDLTVAQARCLFVLARRDGCTMRELSGELRVSPSAACELVDRLVKAELAQRASDPSDRRVVRVRLAKKGRALFAKHKRERRQRLRVLLDRLTEQQRQTMLTALETLDEVVQQAREE